MNTDSIIPYSQACAAHHQCRRQSKITIHFNCLSRAMPGIILAGVLAGAGLLLAETQTAERLGFSALTLAIILGMVVGNTIFPRMAKSMASGVDFSKNKLLRLGIIGFGFRVTFQQIEHIGVQGVLIDIVMIACVFLLAIWLGRKVFKIDDHTAALIGVGSAICGAAAVLATEPVLRASANKVTVAVATVVVFGTLGIFVYPLLYPHLGLSSEQFGLYAGSSIHEVAQVVAAARSVSEDTASAAVIEKMFRVMMLAPFLVLLSYLEKRKQMAAGIHAHHKITIPWFAFAFIGVSAFTSIVSIPHPLLVIINYIDTTILAMAMAALGLHTHFGAMKQAGSRALMLAGSLWIFLIVGGYGINRLLIALFNHG